MSARAPTPSLPVRALLRGACGAATLVALVACVTLVTYGRVPRIDLLFAAAFGGLLGLTVLLEQGDPGPPFGPAFVALFASGMLACALAAVQAGYAEAMLQSGDPTTAWRAAAWGAWIALWDPWTLRLLALFGLATAISHPIPASQADRTGRLILPPLVAAGSVLIALAVQVDDTLTRVFTPASLPGPMWAFPSGSGLAVGRAMGRRVTGYLLGVLVALPSTLALTRWLADRAAHRLAIAYPAARARAEDVDEAVTALVPLGVRSRRRCSAAAVFLVLITSPVLAWVPTRPIAPSQLSAWLQGAALLGPGSLPMRRLAAVGPEDDRLIPGALRALTAKDPRVRRLALDTLARLRGFDQRSVLAAVEAALRDTDSSVRGRAVEVLALAAAGDERLIASLVDVWVTSAADPVTTSRALASAGYRDSRLVRFLAPYLFDASPRVAKFAGHLLGLMGHVAIPLQEQRQTTEALLGLMQEHGPDARLVELLVKHGAVTLDTIEGQLASDAPEHQAVGIELLFEAELAEPERWERLARRVLASPIPAHRRLAAQTLWPSDARQLRLACDVWRSTPELRPDLLGNLNGACVGRLASLTGDDPRLLAFALRVANPCRHARDLEDFLRVWAAADDPALRLTARRVLATTRPPQDVPEAWTQAEPLALLAMLDATRGAPPFFYVQIEALGISDPWLQAAAALSEGAGASATDALASALASPLPDVPLELAWLGVDDWLTTLPGAALRELATSNPELGQQRARELLADPRAGLRHAACEVSTDPVALVGALRDPAPTVADAAVQRLFDLGATRIAPALPALRELAAAGGPPAESARWVIQRLGPAASPDGR